MKTNVPARILIVEDDIDSLCMLCSMVKSWGYIVDKATRGTVALAKIRENCPDVILSDLVMPEMSGLELLRSIRAVRSDCVIFFILTTGYGTVQRGVSAITEGADEVLIKPIDQDYLHDLLHRHGFYGSGESCPYTTGSEGK